MKNNKKLKTKLNNLTKNTINNIEENKKKIIPCDKFQITLPNEKVQVIFQKYLRKEAKKLKIDGFRQGKVPLNIAKKLINSELILDNILKEMLPPYYEKRIKKDKLLPITYPEIKLITSDLEKDLIVEISISQKPEIKLGDYKIFIKENRKKAEKKYKETENQKEQSEEKKKKNDFLLTFIFNELRKKINPKVPELVLKETINDDFKNFQKQLKLAGITLEDYLEKNKITLDSISLHFESQALEKIQTDLIINQIIQECNIKAEKEDWEKINKENKNLEKSQENYLYLEYFIQRRKIFDFILNLK